MTTSDQKGPPMSNADKEAGKALLREHAERVRLAEIAARIDERRHQQQAEIKRSNVQDRKQR